MKKYIQILLFFLLSSNLFASFFVEIDVPQEKLVTQDESGYAKACVPTTLYYLLKLDPDKELVKNIPGESDLQKLIYIIEHGHNLPSELGEDVVFDEDGGTYFYDNALWISSLLPKNFDAPFVTAANRLSNETTKGDYLSRIHGILKSFLSAGKPVKIATEYRYVADGISNFSLGHAVVVVAVQKEIGERDLGFMIKYLDPEYGEVYSAYVYEEINNPFNADIFDDDKFYDSTWSAGEFGVYNDDREFVSSPYLRIAAPLMIPSTSWSWDVEVDSFIKNFMAL